MSRKELEKFDPKKLKPGSTKMIEVVNTETHYHEVHFFCRDHDGELLTGVVHGFRNARAEIDNWKKVKRAKASDDLHQMSFIEQVGQQRG